MKKCIISILVIMFIAAFAVSHAKAYTYNLDYVFNGATPTSTSPWLIADFTQTDDHTVTLTLTAHFNLAGEYISKVAFNVNPSINLTGLSVEQASGLNVAAISKSTQNAQTLGGNSLGSGFDVLFNFPLNNNPNSNRFNGNEINTFDIFNEDTGPKLYVADFINYINEGGADAIVGAKVQGILALDGSSISGDIKGSPVPIPGAAWLLGPGLLSLIGFRKKYLG
jgi:hypothetical protein